jgi:Predicted membrane protein (DUF2306)
MPRSWQRVGAIVVWVTAILVAITSSRYFVPALLRVSETHLVARHPYWVLSHIGGAILATAVGLPQFLASLRNARPTVHRGFGYIYLAAVMWSGIAGMWLSPDTARFLADGFNDGAADPSLANIGPLLGLHPGDSFTAAQFAAVPVSFFLLSVAWLVTTGMAFARARRRRFGEHRAWMMRSYSLTFGAFTVRAGALLFGLLTRDPVLSSVAALWSWPLNLMVAEWLIRNKAQPALATRAASAGQ